MNAQWWTTEVSAVLGTEQFVKVGLRQMSGTAEGRAGRAGGGAGLGAVELSQYLGRNSSSSRSGSGQCQVLQIRQGGAGWGRVGQGVCWGRGYFPLLPLLPSPHLSPLIFLPPRCPAAGLLSLRARAACRRGVHRLGRVRGHGGRRQQGRGAGSGVEERNLCPYPSGTLFHSPVCRNNTYA